MNWKNIEGIEKLNEIINISEKKAVLIFKHSTRCGISRFALRDFERSFDISEEEMEVFYLDLLKYRDISNEIAQRFGIIHQSPQVIVLKNKEAIYNDSHGGISVASIKKAIG